MSPPVLAVPDAAEREALAVFCGRVVRLDPLAVIRLRVLDGHVEAWAPTPFEALAAHTVTGTVTPGDVTVTGSDLLAALSILGGPSVEAGTRCDERWRAPLPGDASWTVVGELPVADANALAEEGIAAGELDRPSLTLTADGVDGATVTVPLRCLVALAGLGLLVTGDDAAGTLRVSVGGSSRHDWVRVAVPGGAVVRRRRPSLTLRPA